ncbi:MAG: glycosyltransferase [Candidatus Angelobacter sp.]
MISTAEQPLVSCIMPTADRRRFVPLAIQNFLQQDYPNRELVILDDGHDSIADLVPADTRVRYIRTTQRQTVGAKRNQCVKASQGNLIMHWDDDDWVAPHRIRYQVEALLREGAEVCGLRQMLFHDLGTSKTWLYTYPPNQRAWLLGGSLLYTRNFWQRSPFPGVQVGEDARFLWNQNNWKVAVLPDYRFYVAMIHPANTSPKLCSDPYWARWPEDPRSIMGELLDLYGSGRAANTPQEVSGGKRMKLNLGCCDAAIPGFVNVDIVAGPGVDQVADLSTPWPWADNSIEYVRAWDIIEHLPDKIKTMNEIYRVLAPGGRAEIAVPTTDGTGAFQDPTHVSFWNRRSFLYYEAGNPYRERFASSYGIRARFRTLWERTDHSVDGPRLTIILEVVKP